MNIYGDHFASIWKRAINRRIRRKATGVFVFLPPSDILNSSTPQNGFVFFNRDVGSPLNQQPRERFPPNRRAPHLVQLVLAHVTRRAAPSLSARGGLHKPARDGCAWLTSSFWGSLAPRFRSALVHWTPLDHRECQAILSECHSWRGCFVARWLH